VAGAKVSLLPKEAQQLATNLKTIMLPGTSFLPGVAILQHSGNRNETAPSRGLQDHVE